MGVGPGDKWSRSQPLYCSGPHLCCHRSIISNTPTSIKHCTSNRVLPGGHLAFCMTMEQRGAQPVLRVQSEMLRSTLDLQILPVGGALGRNISSQSLGSLHLTRLLQRWHRTSWRLTGLWPGFLRCSTGTPLLDWLQWLVVLNIDWEQTIQVKDGDKHCWTSYCNVCFSLKQLIEILHCMLYSITCRLGMLVATLSWLPSSELQHLLGQSPSCGMVLPSCFSPSLTGFQTTRRTSKGVPPIQPKWRVRSTTSAEYFKHA